jgi:glutathione-regulated potassium-efflux system ancillary protein KefC
MDFEWVAIALGDVSWIALAFVLGFAVKAVGLPPLLGFLATGFFLNFLGFNSGEMLQKLADLGITLLLFIVGLKLNLKMLARPQVWAVTSLHILAVVVLFGLLILALSSFNLLLFGDLAPAHIVLVAFALSFSSTVFAVKVLEDKGNVKSLHGRIAIGVLVMQDLAAVIFLVASTGKIPSLWALLLLLLIPLRPAIHWFLEKTGHGELLILYGLVLALGGAELFELVGIKDDLGALIMGVLLSGHAKSAEMSKTMLGFKDLFLVGFFLTIGMTGSLTLAAVITGLMLTPLVVIKSALFFALMSLFKLRARTALLSTLNLSNYSEFGLIVCAIGVSNGWLAADWLVVLAVALSFSFLLAAPLIQFDDRIYRDFRPIWQRLQRLQRLDDDREPDLRNATIAVFGMGRVGAGADDRMREQHGDTVVGIDFDADLVQRHVDAGRHVLHGDPSDADFWDKFNQVGQLNLVMLALPNLQSELDALAQLRAISFDGRIAATARFPDDAAALSEAGATAVFNIYTEAGTGFADLVHRQAESTESTQ